MKTVLVLLLCMVTVTAAQRGRGRRPRGDSIADTGRRGVPDWEISPPFEHDTFTFVRVRYNSHGWRGGWQTDYPDSDLNFSLRLQQLTSLKVNPDPIVLDLMDERLFDYPFLYLIEPGGIDLSSDEAAALRRYCLNGGFLMVDDFWGAYEYRFLYKAMKQAFPEFEPQELPLSHEIFHLVYDLKEKPQVPSINWAYNGLTYEPRSESDTSIVEYKAIFDEEGRIMVLICHNTDLGDGWEREGENREYFEEFSVKKAYPLGINIVTYAMTH